LTSGETHSLEQGDVDLQRLQRQREEGWLVREGEKKKEGGGKNREMSKLNFDPSHRGTGELYEIVLHLDRWSNLTESANGRHWGSRDEENVQQSGERGGVENDGKSHVGLAESTVLSRFVSNSVWPWILTLVNAVNCPAERMVYCAGFSKKKLMKKIIQ